MIAKSLIAAAAVATTMAVALPATQAEAKTNISIGIGIGVGTPGYGYPVYQPYPGYISCKKGANIVDWSGFHSVKAVDCHLPGYKYTAWKSGKKYLVRVNGYGHIVDVDKI